MSEYSELRVVLESGTVIGPYGVQAKILALLDEYERLTQATPQGDASKQVERGFDKLLRHQLQDPEVFEGYMRATKREASAAALREAAQAEEDRCTGDWNGTVCEGCRAFAERLRARATRIEAVSHQAVARLIGK